MEENVAERLLRDIMENDLEFYERFLKDLSEKELQAFFPQKGSSDFAIWSITASFTSALTQSTMLNGERAARISLPLILRSWILTNGAES